MFINGVVLFVEFVLIFGSFLFLAVPPILAVILLAADLLLSVQASLSTWLLPSMGKVFPYVALVSMMTR